MASASSLGDLMLGVNPTMKSLISFGWKNKEFCGQSERGTKVLINLTNPRDLSKLRSSKSN